MYKTIKLDRFPPVFFYLKQARYIVEANFISIMPKKFYNKSKHNSLKK